MESSPGREDVVYVVDDDDDLRDAVASLLRSAGFQVETFPDATAFLDQYSPDSAGCVVLDVRLPGISGLDLQHELLRRGSSLPVILMTGHADVPMAVRAMKEGAREFLVKPVQETELLDAVSAALRHHRATLVDRDASAALRERYARLTSREREVLSRIARGMLNKQVAADLGLSEITIKLHRQGVMKKMGARSLAELVSMYDRLRWSGHEVS
jgi:FixJ family two-component response regulator